MPRLNSGPGRLTIALVNMEQWYQYRGAPESTIAPRWGAIAWHMIGGGLFRHDRARFERRPRFYLSRTAFLDCLIESLRST